MDLSGLRKTLPEVEEPAKKVCAVCQTPAEKSCGACHQIHYCSAEHQKSHWKVHKKDCPPIRIITSPELGPHFVATRDLPPGTLIHTEPPVLVNPFVCSNDGIFSCISCRSILPSAPWPCFQCSTTFFCNLACSMNKIHTEFECGILSKCNEEQRQKLCIPPNLGYLRAMGLKNKDPQTWAKVLKLRGADQYKLGDADENDKWFIREILPLVGEKGVGFETDITKLRGILQQKSIMAHPIVDCSSSKQHVPSQLLYLEGSNFVQNCFPNCSSIIIGKGPQFQHLVKTNVGIKKGSITSIDFQRFSNEYGAMQYKMDLKGGVLCICPRCSDPTELGTMLSAVKCMERDCKDGYLLPVDPKDMAPNAPWRCNRSECKGMLSTWREIDEIIKGLDSDVKAFLASVHLEDLERTKEFLVSLKKKLHPNHWLILYFQNNMISEIVYTEIKKGILGRELCIPGIKLYISMIDDMLKISEFTAPGLSLPKAHLWLNIIGILIAKMRSSMLRSGPQSEEWENEFKRRTIEAIDQFSSIAKFYPEIWTTNLIEDHNKIKLYLLSK